MQVSWQISVRIPAAASAASAFAAHEFFLLLPFPLLLPQLQAAAAVVSCIARAAFS